MIRGAKNTVSELAAYIKKNSKKGYTVESLKWALLNQGYSRIEVDKAVTKATQEMASEAPILRTKPKIKHEIIGLEEQVKKKSLWDNMFS